MKFRVPRAALALCFIVTSIGCGDCSCKDAAPLPGPKHTDFTVVATTTVAALGVDPFDVDHMDLAGPNSHDAQYGKTPEIVAVPGPGYIDVVLRSMNDAEGPRAFYARISDTGGTLALSDAKEIPSLGVLLGFARAADGTFYYATGTYDDDVDASYPGKDVYRTNVVRVYHFNSAGDALFDVDLDLARHAAFPSAEALINPGVASSARLTVAGDVVALVHGINTDPDASLNGTRHQKAISTYLDASTGAILHASGIWMSHSFDQRYLVDGADIVELHLGDAYDRSITYARVVAGDAGNDVSVFNPKGTLGDNNTFTRLGDIVRIPGATGHPMLALYATERTTTTGSRINGSRDLALTRMNMDMRDVAFGTATDVTSSGSSVTNYSLYLTDYHGTSPGVLHAERPKLIPIAANEFLVLWERWTFQSATMMQTFDGTFAMRIDGAGAILSAATRVSDHHLPRGDDAFAYGGGAAWLTGDQTTKQLTLHVVSGALGITETVIP